MNEIMKLTLDELINKQKSDTNTLANYKAQIAHLQEQISQRELAIKLLTAALDPNKKNDTIAESIK
jgi:hypothetical protein